MTRVYNVWTVDSQLEQIQQIDWEMREARRTLHQRIRRAVKDGVSVTAIAAALDVSRTTVYTILKQKS